MINVQTLKGFRDFLPKEERKRQFILDTLKNVFESYGFEPLETPSLEYEEILSEKYGDEGDNLMYKFKDLGGRNVALRYDQTVPLARLVAQYSNELPMPFKRYQMQNVWRAENTQKGRYREFLQVDADIVGTYSPLSDAEIINMSLDALDKLGFKNVTLFINDRKLFTGLETKYILSLDKLDKIGKEEVVKELSTKGLGDERALELFTKIENSETPTNISELIKLIKKFKSFEPNIKFKPTLARGLNYYTGVIFELVADGVNLGSIGGGGRYDDLIGIFSGKEIPAVGFSFGFDRLLEAMEELNLFPDSIRNNTVFVAFSSAELQEKALDITNKLRDESIKSEVYLEEANLEKQLKYADKKQLPYSIVVKENELVFKDMEKRSQETLTLEELIKKLK